MICRQCLSRARSRGLPSSLRPRRHATVLRLPIGIEQRRPATTSSPAQVPATPVATAPPSSSASTNPSPIANDGTANRPRRAPAKTMSSVLAGAPLRGLSYLKNEADPIAAADADYPSWLWSCLDKDGASGKTEDGAASEGDEFSKSKKQRRLAAKRLRKEAAANPQGRAPKVPLVEQSIDLPANPQNSLAGALEAVQAREGLTRALRVQRRGGIKEKNFLKGMR